MKKALVVLVFIASFVFVSTLAGISVEKQNVVDKNPSLKLPQRKLKTLPKSAVVPKTDQESGAGNTETQPAETQSTTPQGVANIHIQSVVFMPASQSSPSCQLKWVVKLENTGTAASGSNVVLRPSYRKTINDNALAWQDIQLIPIEPGTTQGFTGYVPPRMHEEAELVLMILDGSNNLGGGAYRLPDSVKATAGNVLLGDAVISTAQLTFVVQNTGSVSVNPVDCLVRGVVDASGASTERISEHSITCLPAGGSETVSVAIPANPYHAYQVRIVPSGLSETVAERVYPRP